jgi:hypothetical protein
MRPGAKALLSIFLSPTGSTEVHDGGINVFHSLQTFLADVDALPFDSRLTGLRFVPGMSANEAISRDPAKPSFGYEHNWYVLTRLGGE